MQIPYTDVPRNYALLDPWSFVHLSTGAIFGWLMHPLWAIALMALYEPFEVLILSQFLYDNFGIVYGNEGLVNSLTDIVVNSLGVAFGYFILRKHVPPPFTLFEKE